MSSSFKRVISHPDEVGQISKKMSTGPPRSEQQEQQQHAMMPTGAAAAAAETPPPAVVECDDIQQPEPSSVVPFCGPRPHHQLSFSSSSSSLSDRSEDHDDTKDDDDDMKNETANTPPETTGLRWNEVTLARVDSAVSSDSSVRTGNRSPTGSGSGTWGWFQDVHVGNDKKGASRENMDSSDDLLGDTEDDGPSRVIDISQQDVDNKTAAAAMAVTAPTYVLEESLSSQQLWKHTAGNRPPQPEEERTYYEMLYRQNFIMSNVNYDQPLEVLTQGTNSFFSDHHPHDSHLRGQPISNYILATDSVATDAEVAEAIERLHGYTGGSLGFDPRTQPEVVNKKVKGSKEELIVLIRGDNVFGNSVCKSFGRFSPSGSREVDTVNISIASYRVVESKKHGRYAQFLVIYREGSIRDTIGVWKRYSDFEVLSSKVMESHDSCHSVLANMSPLAVTEDGDIEHLPNAIKSWRLLKKRQRWYRCLDAGYLSLKVFLLERFLDDILFESSSPKLLRDFVIYDTSK